MSFISTDIPNSPYGSSEDRFINPGDPTLRRSSATMAIVLDNEGDKSKLPSHFPHQSWLQLSALYRMYWDWVTGSYFEQHTTIDQDGVEASLYPLRINVPRDMSRKHAYLLFGEVPDGARQLVHTKLVGRHAYGNKAVEEKRRERAQQLESIIAEIWDDSDGRTIQQENGLYSQFLGGCYFQIEYKPWRKDRRYPLQIRNLLPDFVFPRFDRDNREIIEAWIVYRLDARDAAIQFGLDDIPSGEPYVVLAEHWTLRKMSMYINGKPLKAEYLIPGESQPYTMVYENRENPFGKVPIFYIPRVREGGWMGSSLIPDIAHLTKEFNSRAADWGTIVHEASSRRWFGRNIQKNNVKPKQIQDDFYYVDLGTQVPGSAGAPEIWAVDPPKMGNFIEGNVKFLWDSLLQMGNLTPVHYGFDEGSQRSGETLKVRFWASQAQIRVQRLYWENSLSNIAKMLLDMLAILKVKMPEGVDRPALYEYLDYNIFVDWAPLVARERETVLSEVKSLHTGKEDNLMTTRRALETLGDVDDVEAELEGIEDEKEEAQKRAMDTMKAKAETSSFGKSGGSSPSSGPGRIPGQAESKKEKD